MNLTEISAILPDILVVFGVARSDGSGQQSLGGSTSNSPGRRASPVGVIFQLGPQRGANKDPLGTVKTLSAMLTAVKVCAGHTEAP